jgi:predicted nucleic-acid-binding protein
MSNRIYLDANILLDYVLDRPEKESAGKILQLINKGIIKAYISSSIIHILSYVLSKTFSVEKTKEVIISIIHDIELIDMPKEIVLQSLNSKMNDIEDALQYHIALYNKIDFFISNDKKLKKEAIPALPIYTPKELMVILEG